MSKPFRHDPHEVTLEALRSLAIGDQRVSDLGQAVYDDDCSRNSQSYARPGMQIARSLERRGLVKVLRHRDEYSYAKITRAGRRFLRNHQKRN